jgi:hypothetical protein
MASLLSVLTADYKGNSLVPILLLSGNAHSSTLDECLIANDL